MPESKAVLYRNWIKAGLAFLYTKHGIQAFIVHFIAKYAQYIYTKALIQQGHPPGTVCKSCTIQNVLKCRTKDICIGRTCTFHNSAESRLTSRPCPLSICGFIRDALIDSHKHGGPSFKNTTAEDWCTSSWEIAKCFLQASGYKDIRTADDTDFAGLVSIIINHKLFQGELAENMKVQNNIFAQVRDIRNKVMHDAKMEVHSKDIAVYINVLTKLLSDPIRLRHLPDAKDCIQKLTELQNDVISITTVDEERVKEESLRAIKESRDQGILDLENEKIGIVSELSDTTDTALAQLGEKKDEVDKAIDTLQTNIQTAKGTIQAAKHDGLKELQDIRTGISENLADEQKRITSDFDTKAEGSLQLITNKTMDGVSEINKEVKLGVQTLKKQVKERSYETSFGRTSVPVNKDAVVDEVLNRLQNQQLSLESYTEEKKELRLDLITQYEERFYKMPFSPLIQEEEIEVDKLFVMPSLRIVEHDLPKSYTGESHYRYMRTFKDFFQKDNRQARRVYIQSDAGRGKTTLCQMMLQTWCKAHLASEDVNLSTDEAFLKSFEFLFYLPLRSLADLYYIEDMIKALLIREKYHSVLDKVIRDDSDKCILILDGLDEWSIPEGIKPVKDSGNIPYINPKERFTILTTSRPWKLEALRLKTSRIDQEIELLGTSERTAELLVSKLLAILENKFGRPKKASTLMDELKERNLVHFTKIPFILMQVVCLWYDGKEYGNTQVEVYSNMIKFIIELAKERFDEDEPIPSKEETDTILGSVSELAFKTLFRKDANSMILFPKSVAKPFDIDISKDDISFCLRVGLLSQSKYMLFATTRMKTLSFLHKTFHEFFAAIFISSDEAVVDDMLDRLANIQTIFEMERVLVFLSGLKREVVNRVIKHIADKTDRDDQFLEYRQSASSRRYFQVEENVLRVQNLVLECITEGFKDDYSTIELVLRDITTIDFDNKYTEKHMECLKIDGVRSVAVDNNEIPFLLPPILKNETKNIVKFNGYVGSQDQLDMMKTIIEHTQGVYSMLRYLLFSLC